MAAGGDCAGGDSVVRLPVLAGRRFGGGPVFLHERHAVGVLHARHGCWATRWGPSFAPSCSGESSLSTMPWSARGTWLDTSGWPAFWGTTVNAAFNVVGLVYAGTVSWSDFVPHGAGVVGAQCAGGPGGGALPHYLGDALRPPLASAAGGGSGRLRDGFGGRHPDFLPFLVCLWDPELPAGLFALPLPGLGRFAVWPARGNHRHAAGIGAGDPLALERARAVPGHQRAGKPDADRELHRHSGDHEHAAGGGGGRAPAGRTGHGGKREAVARGGGRPDRFDLPVQARRDAHLRQRRLLPVPRQVQRRTARHEFPANPAGGRSRGSLELVQRLAPGAAGGFLRPPGRRARRSGGVAAIHASAACSGKGARRWSSRPSSRTSPIANRPSRPCAPASGSTVRSSPTSRTSSGRRTRTGSSST